MSMENRLQHLRKKHHLSQEQVAELVNTTRQTVSQWENGKSVPSLENLNILARHYGVTLDYLVNGEEPPCSTPEPSAPVPARSVRHTVLQTVCIALCLATLALVISVFIKEDEPQPTGHGIIVSQEDMDVEYAEPSFSFDLTWPDE
jgi:transcriptional regulator with XRE-family HTH domain